MNPHVEIILATAYGRAHAYHYTTNDRIIYFCNEKIDAFVNSHFQKIKEKGGSEKLIKETQKFMDNFDKPECWDVLQSESFLKTAKKLIAGKTYEQLTKKQGVTK